MILAGVDFGSKTSGTTVICFGSTESIPNFISAEKKQDADEWLIEHLNIIKPELVFIDAPLSLPKALLENNVNGNFLYRQADMETGALSPLFLGTYTARAIKLMLSFKNTVPFFETYPTALLKILELDNLYHKKMKLISDELLKKVNDYAGIRVQKKSIINLHYFDSYLCWISAKRYVNKQAVIFGNEIEGLIYV